MLTYGDIISTVAIIVSIARFVFEMIKYNNEKNPYQQNKKANDAMGLRGQSVDLAV